MDNKEIQANTQAPEKLSGHDLVSYLIANPHARGNFKYHTLRSCMWRDLLIARPEFEDVAAFGKIWHYDIYKILIVQPQLACRFDFSKLWDSELKSLFMQHPELANPETTKSVYNSTWSELLGKHPHLAPLCPFDEFMPNCWVNLISRQLSFADQCPWHTFESRNWADMVEKKNICLKYFKPEYLQKVSAGMEEKMLQWIFCSCYFGKALPFKGAFEKGVADAASFLIFKRMDRENGKKYLKKMLEKGIWEFVEQLCGIAPEEAMDVYGKKYIRFFMTLMASDQVFEKLFPLFDLKEKDPAGNSLLMAALIHGLSSNDMSRYEFLQEQGLDPDEKNIAGFSCNDLIAFLAEKKAKAEADRLARNEKARKRARKRRKAAKKGK